MRTLLIPLALLAATALAALPAHGAHEATGSDKAQEALTALLPPDEAVPGWKKAAAPGSYNAQNLWDWINGAAVLYLDYGFTALVTADYTNGASTAVVEIYRMQSPLHGFAIYAAERSTRDKPIDIGVQGYRTDNALNFWKGPYYVKVTSYRTGEAEKNILKDLAGNVDSRIPGRYAEPEGFQYFPTENRIEGSERYIPRNFLGHPFFQGGYRVDYQEGGKGKYQVFLVPNASAEEAREAFGKYRRHLEARGAGVTLEKKAGCQLMRAADRETVFLYGSYVGGVSGELDGPQALEAVEQMLAKLKP